MSATAFDRVPVLTFATCTLGMLAGLGVDSHGGRIAVLGSLCATGVASPFNLIQFHWRELPAMHVGMILGVLAAIPGWDYRSKRVLRIQLLRTLFCYSSMLIGMEAGMLIVLEVFGPYQTVAGILLGMMTGMTCGLISSEAILGCLHGRGFGPARV